MTDEIKVHVVKYPDRANLVMRYVDPFTGRASAAVNEDHEAKRSREGGRQVGSGVERRPLQETIPHDLGRVPRASTKRKFCPDWRKARANARRPCSTTSKAPSTRSG